MVIRHVGGSRWCGVDGAEGLVLWMADNWGRVDGFSAERMSIRGCVMVIRLGELKCLGIS